MVPRKILSTICATSLLALCSCSLIVTPPLDQPQQSLGIAPGVGASTPLFVFSHGHHSGLTLPAEVFREDFGLQGEPLEDQWLEFGWGDEGFYRTDQVSLRLAMQALLYPTPSVMHLVLSSQSPEKLYPYSPVRVFELKPAQTAALRQYLLKSFQRNDDGTPIELGPGRYGRSQFYRGRRKFFFPRTCNSWTAGALRTTGREVHAITAPGLLRQL